MGPFGCIGSTLTCRERADNCVFSAGPSLRCEIGNFFSISCLTVFRLKKRLSWLEWTRLSCQSLVHSNQTNRYFCLHGLYGHEAACCQKIPLLPPHVSSPHKHGTRAEKKRDGIRRWGGGSGWQLRQMFRNRDRIFSVRHTTNACPYLAHRRLSLTVAPQC